MTFCCVIGVKNQKANTIIKRQAPTHPNICVLMPAAHSSRSRSKPIRLPSAAAASNRSSVSQLDSKAIWPQIHCTGLPQFGGLFRSPSEDSQDSKQNLVNQSGLAYFPPQGSNHS